MKPRRQLNLGDKVKFIGAATTVVGIASHRFITKNVYCEVLALPALQSVVIRIEEDREYFYMIHRNQVTHVRRKKTYPKTREDFARLWDKNATVVYNCAADSDFFNELMKIFEITK